MSNSPGASVSSVEALPSLAVVPAVERAAQLVTAENMPLRSLLVSIANRYKLIGKEIFVASTQDKTVDRVTVIKPQEELWWPEVKENRFTKVTGRTPWGTTQEEAKQALVQVPSQRYPGYCRTLEDQYRAQEGMNSALPAEFTKDTAMRLGQDLAESLAFFTLAASEKEDDRLRNLSLEVFFLRENIIPDVVYKVLKKEIELLRATVATKLQAIKVLMDTPGIDHKTILSAVWNGVLTAGHEFAEKNFTTLQQIAIIARTKTSLQNSLSIINTL